MTPPPWYERAPAAPSSASCWLGRHRGHGRQRPDAERLPLPRVLMTQTVEQAGNVVLVHPKTLLAGDQQVAGFHWSLRGQSDFRGTGIAAG